MGWAELSSECIRYSQHIPQPPLETVPCRLPELGLSGLLDYSTCYSPPRSLRSSQGFFPMAHHTPCQNPSLARGALGDCRRWVCPFPDPIPSDSYAASQRWYMVWCPQTRTLATPSSPPGVPASKIWLCLSATSLQAPTRAAILGEKWGSQKKFHLSN